MILSFYFCVCLSNNQLGQHMFELDGATLGDHHMETLGNKLGLNCSKLYLYFMVGWYLKNKSGLKQEKG